MTYKCIKPFYLDLKDGNWPVAGQEYIAIRLNSLWNLKKKNSSTNEFCIVEAGTEQSLEIGCDVLEYFFKPLHA